MGVALHYLPIKIDDGVTLLSMPISNFCEKS